MDQAQVALAVKLEVEALTLVGGPLTSIVIGWLLRQLALRLRDKRAVSDAARLVAWAQQTIPDKSARYDEVAGLLSRRYGYLDATGLEVLIESEVLAVKAALRDTPLTTATALPGGTAPSAPAGVATPGTAQPGQPGASASPPVYPSAQGAVRPEVVLGLPAYDGAATVATGNVGGELAAATPQG